MGSQSKLTQFNNNQQNFGYRPQQFGFRPQQFGISPQQFNMRPQQFNMRPQQFGMQPQIFNKPQQFGMRPQQFGMRPQQFGNQQQNFYKPQQFGYKPQLNKNQYTGPSDVTMRTAPPLKTNQQGFQLNELDLDNTYYDDACSDVYPLSYDNCCYEEYSSSGLNVPELDYYENQYPTIIPEVTQIVPTNNDDKDFQVEASELTKK
ncbi:unnamed protein product [Parnassius mnemosyne]|uniref:Uncharacterized protein n=1 Tax=Parnassius mnemosyne TaxID=213953 RepID=A0AAV1M234_9NEOP